MQTYKRIQEGINRKFGVAVKTCWIADVKAGYGLTSRVAWNRAETGRKHPCPTRYRSMIEEALGIPKNEA